MTIDVDATLITAHSEKERAAGNYKHGYRFHPLTAYADETREAFAILLRPGNAGSNTAADHITVIDRALGQIADTQLEDLEILIRTDTAGATHGTADHCHQAGLRFSFGYELSEPVRAAILHTPADAWVPAERPNGQVIEITEHVDLAAWPAGSRVIVRRERPHPGAQFSFTDHDGYRFQAILTDQTDPNIAVVERRHRQRSCRRSGSFCFRITSATRLPEARVAALRGTRQCRPTPAADAKRRRWNRRPSGWVEDDAIVRGAALYEGSRPIARSHCVAYGIAPIWRMRPRSSRIAR